jgi:hypothetical protein
MGGRQDTAAVCESVYLAWMAKRKGNKQIAKTSNISPNEQQYKPIHLRDGTISKGLLVHCPSNTGEKWQTGVCHMGAYSIRNGVLRAA